MKIKALILALFLPGMAQAATCTDAAFEGQSYTVCEATPTDDLRLFLNGETGPYGSFAAVNTALEPSGQELAFGPRPVPMGQATLRAVAALERYSTMAAPKAGRSGGVREVMTLPSTTAA